MPINPATRELMRGAYEEMRMAQQDIFTLLADDKQDEDAMSIEIKQARRRLERADKKLAAVLKEVG